MENGEHGSSVAGPIAKQIIDTYLLDILKLDFGTFGDDAQTEHQITAADE